MAELQHDNVYLQDTTSGGEWEAHEAGRLQNMDELFATVATADLVPVLDVVKQTQPDDRPVRFIDIGAGTGQVTERLAASQHIDYWALDANQSFLDLRPTPVDHKVLGRSEDLPFADGEFDITYTRAVTAWNADPKQSIAEQLRITRVGGAAVFTEFDWGDSGVDIHSDAAASFMAARAIMMRTLLGVGFRPEYGYQLGADIDAAAEEQGLQVARQEVKHALPEGDYRKIFLETAENIRKQLNEAGPSVPQARLMASMLGDHIYKVRHAKVVNLRLPALVTNTVLRIA